MDTLHLIDRLWAAAMPMQRLAWEQGVCSHAAIDVGRTEDVLAIARDAIMHADEQGRLAATGDAGLVNGGALGEAVALLAAHGDGEATETLERQRWWLLRWSPRDDEGVVWHLAGHSQVWVDSIYMVVPFLILTGDVAPADMQYRMHREHLWNPHTGLYAHRADTVTKRPVRPAPWASGNGWAAAGLARALHIGGDGVPQEMRSRWQRDTRALLETVRPYATPAGRFPDILDQADRFTDGTAGLMFAYAAFTGVADGWLDESYGEVAERWCAAALASVDDKGIVRGVAGAPHFDREGTSAEAQAFGILALAARTRVKSGADATVSPPTGGVPAT